MSPSTFSKTPTPKPNMAIEQRRRRNGHAAVQNAAAEGAAESPEPAAAERAAERTAESRAPAAAERAADEPAAVSAAEDR